MFEIKLDNPKAKIFATTPFSDIALGVAQFVAKKWSSEYHDGVAIVLNDGKPYQRVTYLRPSTRPEFLVEDL